MRSPEDRLRGALHADEPAPLDPGRIIRAARHRRVVTRAWFGAAAAVVVVAGAIGVPLAVERSQEQGAVTTPVPEARTQTPGVPVPTERPSDPTPPAAARPGPRLEFIPGRTIVLEDQRWCVVDPTARTPAQCAGQAEHSLRTTDAEGTQWLVVVAPSGPHTALLQVQQPAGWVDLQTSRLPGAADEPWVGVVPAAQAPATVDSIRALDGDGVEVWSTG